MYLSRGKLIMRLDILLAMFILGGDFIVRAEPEAAPDPSPIADPGRKSQGASIPPVFVEEPSDEIAKRGGTVDLYCRAEGYPSPHIYWYKDGHLLRKNAKNILVVPNKLHLFNVRSGAAEGVYQCVAKNGGGEIRSRNATLSISYIKEDFRVIPKDTVAAVGEKAVMECQGPRGLPEPKIEWKKDNELISTKSGRYRIEKGNLIITGARSSDSGQYKCIASNEAGTRESLDALLAVYQPPQFTVTPEDVTAKEGQDVELACQAQESQGETTPRIRWTKTDGVILGQRFARLDNGNLQIKDIKSEDEGEYVCNAANRLTSKSASARVTVNTKPEFVRVPKDMSVRIGATVKLSCSATGKPKPSILWHINGGSNLFVGSVTEDGTVSVNEAGELTIYNARFTDTGRYTCQAVNTAGQVTAHTQLTVVSRKSDINPPIISQGPHNMTVAYGTPVELRCTTSTIATTKFDWTKEGSKVEPGSKYTITSGNLKISSAQSGDTGKYTCTATNDFGWSKWDAWITVAAKGATVPPTKYDATKVPGTPGAPTLTGSTTTSISLQWTPGTRAASPTATGYILEYYCQECDIATWTRVNSKITSKELTVKNLIPGSSYVFLVRAFNEFGMSDPSPVSETITTQGENPTTADEKEKEELRRQLLQISVRLTTVHPLSSSSTSGGIRLEWVSSANCDVIDGFKIYLQPVSVRNGAQIVETASCYARNTEINNLKSRVVYEIRIRPYKNEVMGHLSPIMLASPESEGTTPAAPTLRIDLKIPEEKDRAVGSFSWEEPSSIMPEYISRYTLRCYDKSKAYDVTRDVSGTSLTLDDLPRGRDYFATITFSTLLGEGITSEKEEFSVAATASGDEGFASLLKNPGVLAGIGACVVIIIAIVVAVILYRRHKKNQKSRGLHVRSFSFTPQSGGRPGIPMDPFRDIKYSEGFTMNIAKPSGSGNNFDNDGGAKGNMYLQRPNMPGPHSVARNTTVSLNNSNGNVGTTLSPDMSDIRPVARQTSSFSYVTDQLTSMSSIPPQFSSPNSTRTPTQVMSNPDLQLQLQQQQYNRQISDSQTIPADDQYSPQENLIDMNTPLEQNPNSGYFTRDSDLPPPPPSPPMSLKTSLSDRTNRSRGSSKHSADRGSNHSGSRGRRSRERNRTFQPLERVPTDTDTGIDSPQQTPSPPRPSDLRGDHSQHSGMSSQSRSQAGFAYPVSKQHHNSSNGRRRNDGIAVEYNRMADPNLGYLGGPSEGETESEVEGMRNARTNNYHMSLPDEVRNSVAVSSVSMMNAYDSESDCGSSQGMRSRTSSVESLNMESASQVGMYNQQHVMSPNRPGQGVFVSINNNQYNNGVGGAPQTRPNFVKPKVPRKNHIAHNQYNNPGLNGHQQMYPEPVHQGFINPKNPNLAPEQFLNRVNSASSSESSSYHQNTADSGMSAGVGSYGHNSLNSSSSAESGPRGHMARSRTTGSLSAEQGPVDNNVPQPFASVDRRYLPENNNSEYPKGSGRQPAPRRPPRVDSFNKSTSKSPQRKNSQDSNVSLPPRDTTAYVDYETIDDDRQPMLHDNDYRTNEDDAINEPSDESKIAFLNAKSVFGAGINGGKPLRGRHQELSDVPEASTSDFCEDYSDRSQ